MYLSKQVALPLHGANLSKTYRLEPGNRKCHVKYLEYATGLGSSLPLLSNLLTGLAPSHLLLTANDIAETYACLTRLDVRHVFTFR
jgi:hypothetical protein